MSAVGHLFEDDRREGAPYCLFVEGFSGEGRNEGDTWEYRFRNLWESVEGASAIREDIGAFDLRLGEPRHYSEIAEDYPEDFHGR